MFLPILVCKHLYWLVNLDNLTTVHGGPGYILLLILMIKEAAAVGKS